MDTTDPPKITEAARKDVTIYFEGRPLPAKQSQTIAGALVGNSIRTFGFSRITREPRGIYCAVGKCTSCFLTVDGREHVISCITQVEDGMQITLNEQDPDLSGTHEY